MTPDELAAALEQQPPLSHQDTTRLAGQIREPVTLLVARALALAGAADRDVAVRARSLVSRLDELAIAPLLDGPPPTTLPEELWRLQLATDICRQSRARLAERLRAVLADRRPIPDLPADPRVEEPVRPRRMCDEAYCLLRALVHLNESREQATFDQWAFLRLSEAERDVEIAQTTAGLPFTRLVEDLEG
jgi:hypothetical protein